MKIILKNTNLVFQKNKEWMNLVNPSNVTFSFVGTTGTEKEFQITYPTEGASVYLLSDFIPNIDLIANSLIANTAAQQFSFIAYDSDNNVIIDKSQTITDAIDGIKATNTYQAQDGVAKIRLGFKITNYGGSFSNEEEVINYVAQNIGAYEGDTWPAEFVPYKNI